MEWEVVVAIVVALVVFRYIVSVGIVAVVGGTASVIAIIVDVVRACVVVAVSADAVVIVDASGIFIIVVVTCGSRNMGDAVHCRCVVTCVVVDVDVLVMGAVLDDVGVGITCMDQRGFCWRWCDDHLVSRCHR